MTRTLFPDSIRCPSCGFAGELEDFDIIGACWGNVFCTQCSCEFDPKVGSPHLCEGSPCKIEAKRLEEGHVKWERKRRTPARKRDADLD